MTTDDFREQREADIDRFDGDDKLHLNAEAFLDSAVRTRYFYNFEWMGLPVIQFSDDLVALQEIIWRTKPNVIIETGLAHGGSAAFYGTMLATMNQAAYRMKSVISIEKGVIEGVRRELLDRLLALRVRSIVIEGDSTSPETMDKIREYIEPEDRVMVCLDSLHTSAHVFAEITALAHLVSPKCYLVVFDTFVDRRALHLYRGKTCWPGNSPMDAVRDGIEGFDLDTDIARRFLISSNPNGYFRKRES